MRILISLFFAVALVSEASAYSTLVEMRAKLNAGSICKVEMITHGKSKKYEYKEISFPGKNGNGKLIKTRKKVRVPESFAGLRFSFCKGWRGVRKNASGCSVGFPKLKPNRSGFVTVLSTDCLAKKS